MDISLFWEFLVLAEARNYSKAAYQLSLSESSLSRHIKAFEQELGVVLFDRNPRSVTLTKYGEIMIKYAQQIMHIRMQYTNEFKQLTASNHKLLRICSSYNIESLVASFKNKFPEIEVEVQGISDPTELVAKLHNCECDVAFIIYLPDNLENIKVEIYETDSFCAVLPAYHPLASRTSIKLIELADENFISFANDDIKTKKMVELCRKAGFTPAFRTIAGSLASMISLLKYNGTTLLLRKVAEKDNMPGVSLIDIVPKISLNIYLCTSTLAELSSEAKTFIDFALNKQTELKNDSQNNP